MWDVTRTIETPGHGLLPPSPRPIFPPDLKPNELVRVVPPCPPWRPEMRSNDFQLVRKSPETLPDLDSRYWHFGEAFTHHPNDTLDAWKNNPGPGMPVYGMGNGLERIPDVVEFRFKPKKRKRGMAEFWKAYGVMIMSTRLLNLLREMDAEAIVHKPIAMRDLDGNLFDEDHHFVDVVRHVEAVDYANSIVDYYGGDTSSPRPDRPRVQRIVSTRFREDIDPSFHLFRQADPRGEGRARGCFVSNALRRRLKQAKPAFLNIALDPLYYQF